MSYEKCPGCGALEGRLHVMGCAMLDVTALAHTGQAAPAGEVASGQGDPTNDQIEAAFDTWLHRVCPSGDVESVQRQWEESSDYEELFSLATPATEPAAPGYVSDEEIHRIADETFRDYVEDRNDDADIAFARAVLAAVSQPKEPR